MSKVEIPVVDASEEARPFQLTEQSDIWWGWRWSRLTVRNPFSVTIATGLSALGMAIPGFWGRGIPIGVAASGAGNAASTAFYWETRDLRLIEARMTRDFPLLQEKIAASHEKVRALFHAVFPSNDKEVREKLQQLVVEAGKVAEATIPLWRRILLADSRHLRNFLRLALAGGLTFGGGVLGSCYSASDGTDGLLFLLLASALAGVGNGVSTKLAFEPDWEKTVCDAALKGIPELFSLWEKGENDFPALLESVRVLLGEELEGRYAPLSPPPSIVVDFKEPRHDCPCMAGRTARNLTNCALAGVLSATGQFVGTFNE